MTEEKQREYINQKKRFSDAPMTDDEYRKVKANFIEMAQFVLLFGLIFAIIFGFKILGA